MAPVLCLKPPERRTFVIDMSPTQTTRSAAPDARKPQINGELVCWNDERVDFAALQRRLHPSQPRAQELAVAMPAAYVVFDILALAGTDVRMKPYAARRTLLEDLWAGSSRPASS